MGFGLIVLVAAVAAAFYFGGKAGWGNAFATLGNSARSRFSQSPSPDGGVVFDVTPARPSRGAFIFLLVGVLISSLMAVSAIGMLGLIPLTIGILGFPIGARHRVPATITVSGSGVSNGQNTWSLADIAGINIRRGSNINTEDPGQIIQTTPGGRMVSGGKPTSVMLSKALNRGAVERSYLLTLRSRTGSEEAVVSGGLTLDCAQALRDDLSEEIAKHSHFIS